MPGTLLKMLLMVAVVTLSITAPAAAADDDAERSVVDRIVGVVGDEIILMSDLQQTMRVHIMNNNINTQNSAAIQKLQHQVLQSMIDERLLLEKADQDSIKADPKQVDTVYASELSRLKDQLGGEDNYQKALLETGINEQQLRYMTRMAAQKNVLQRMIVDEISMRISVTPQEIEEWFAAHQDSLPTLPAQYKLSHIVMVPKVSDDARRETMEKIREIRERAIAGEDFSALAREFSDDTVSAEKGGSLGYFGRGELIDEFTDAAFALKKGDISPVVETIYGLHLIKAEDFRTVVEDGRQVDKVFARHILLLMQPGEAEEAQTMETLNGFKERIEAGTSTFEELARQYSEDPESAELGGKFQWLTEEQLTMLNVPEYAALAKSLDVGDISDPIKTVFGYAIVKLDDVRPEHKLNQRDDRTQVENYIREQKTIKELQRILADLRSKTYIDIRI